MSPLFKKLNLGKLSVIQVLDAPDSFETELLSLAGVAVQRTVTGKIDFAIAFVKTQAQLESACRKLTKASEGDALVWIAYPKGTSKKYKCEFNRDSGWPTLSAAGFEPVRMVAIDEDWSALRFRRVEYIKTLARDPARAISSAGK